MCAPLITCFQRTRFTYMHKDCIGKKTGLLWIANHFFRVFCRKFWENVKIKLWLSILPLKSNQRKEKHHWRLLKRYKIRNSETALASILHENTIGGFHAKNLFSYTNLPKTRFQKTVKHTKNSMKAIYHISSYSFCRN